MGRWKTTESKKRVSHKKLNSLQIIHCLSPRYAFATLYVLQYEQRFEIVCNSIPCRNAGSQESQRLRGNSTQ